jgi:hypothetical protein
VNEDLPYTISFTIKGSQINELNSTLRFSKPVLKPNNAYSLQTDEFLQLDAQSSISSEITILKPSLYTVGINAKTCAGCTYMTVKIGEEYKNFDLSNIQNEWKWFYMAANLNKGAVSFSIFTDNITEIDKVIIFSDSVPNETVDDLFKLDEYQHSISRSRSGFATYAIKADVTKPFMLTFSPPYPQLWTATVNGKQYEPVWLDNNLIGYSVAEVGIINATINPQPLQTLGISSIVTILALIIFTAYFVIRNNLMKTRLRGVKVGR